MNHNFSCLKCQLTSYQSILFLVIREPGTAPIKGKATNAAVFIHSDIFWKWFYFIPIFSLFGQVTIFFCFDKNDGLRNTEKHATNSWFYFRRWAAESLISKKIHFFINHHPINNRQKIRRKRWVRIIFLHLYKMASPLILWSSRRSSTGSFYEFATECTEYLGGTVK